MSSSIAKSFATVKARQRPLREKAHLVKEVNKTLRSWYTNLSPDLKIAIPVDTKKIPRGLCAEHLIYLHLFYYGNLTAIHSIFGHPWNLNDAQFSIQDDTVVMDQIEASSDALAEASRSIILITRSISVDAVAPVWLVFYYPLLGMISMFVSILKSPAGAATEKNMAVIEMAAGYFAYLDYSTDAVFSFDLVKNLAQWARQAVSQVRDRVPTPQATQFSTERDVLPPMDNFSVDLSPDAAYLVGSLLEAGSDTTYAILAGFVLAMLVHPDVQRRAQVELDQAVGHMRLPHTQDAGKMLGPH
ncbi:unnamed protein product [Alternaria alternata]